MGEILEMIREIADRLDLLALNASLEGTRAGEAGKGFQLVAGEIRRLAERVTASVRDIKEMVGEVRASSSATVLVTEESRKLAESTTTSARQISLVTPAAALRHRAGGPQPQRRLGGAHPVGHRHHADPRRRREPQGPGDDLTHASSAFQVDQGKVQATA
jgi:hypothetical protein